MGSPRWQGRVGPRAQIARSGTDGDGAGSELTPFPALSLAVYVVPILRDASVLDEIFATAEHAALSKHSTTSPREAQTEQEDPTRGEGTRCTSFLERRGGGQVFTKRESANEYRAVS